MSFLKIKRNVCFFLLFLFIFNIGSVYGNLYSGLYVACSMGITIEKFKEKDNSINNWSGLIGYSFPVFLKAEVFLKKMEINFIGAGVRLTVLPFINLKGGIEQQISKKISTDDKNINSKYGYYAGLGFDFWLIPKIDIFTDLTYHHVNIKKYDHNIVELEERTDMETGIRYYF